MPVKRGGVTLLGCPLGDVNFTAGFFKERCDEIIKECRVAARFSSRQLELLLVIKAVAPRITHLLRSTRWPYTPKYGSTWSG